MANQTQPILLRRLTTAGAKPAASEFTLNTFVVNTKDSILYFLDGSGNVQGLPILPGVTSAELTLASAATTDLATVISQMVAITGTTAITSFGTGANLYKVIRFTAALTLTYNATSLIIPGAASITTVAGDTAVVTSDASGNWRVRSYTKADGTPLLGGVTGRRINVAGLASGGGLLTADPTITVTKASAADALAMTSDAIAVTPLGMYSAINPSMPMPNDGLAADGASARRIIITSDNINATANWGGISGRAFRVCHTLTAGFIGGRIATESTVIHSAADDPSNTISEVVALTGSAYGTSANGFGGTTTTPRGSLYAGNSYVETRNGYTNLINVTSHEFNLNTLAGSSMFLRLGIQIVSRGPVRGSLDAAIGISAGGTGGGTRSGILIGDQNSYGISPIDATGSLFSTYTNKGTQFSIATAFDLSAFDFTSYLLRSNMLSIDNNGNMTLGRLNSAATTQIYFRSGGYNQPFDARIFSSGGSSTANQQGTLSFAAANIKMFCPVLFQSNALAPPASFFSIACDDNVVAIYYRNASGQLKIATLSLANTSG